jgi:hypothetical protein
MLSIHSSGHLQHRHKFKFGGEQMSKKKLVIDSTTKSHDEVLAEIFKDEIREYKRRIMIRDFALLACFVGYGVILALVIFKMFV